MVRYADAPSVDVSASSTASAERLWPLISDIELPARFSDEFEGATWLDEGAPFTGARFVGRNANAALGAWEVTCTLERCEPGVAFGWVVGDPNDAVARWCFEIAEHDGGCELRFTATMGPGRSGLSPMIEARPDREEQIVAMRLEMWSTNMEATVAGIVALAEQA